MDGEDKNVKVVSTSERAAPRKHRLQFVFFVLLGVAAIVAIIFLLSPTVLQRAKTARSNKLISQVNSITDGTHQCDFGLKQLKSTAPKLADDKTYTNAAREKALSYLMPCTYISGDKKQALIYANELSQVYTAEGHKKNSIQQRHLNEYITFMKTKQ